MTTRTVELVVEGSFDAAELAAGFDDIGDAAGRMADDVDQASRTADGAADRMSTIGDAADGMGSSASQAAGGLGDLGGALSAMPGPLGAVGTGMETFAPLVMGVTGATDLMTLAMNSNIVTTVRQTAANAANAVKTTVMGAASKAAAVGQWALNAALNANPIGLVVIAVAALVGGLILAYRHSETFRQIVDKAMSVAHDAVDKVVDVVQAVVDKVKGPASDVWEDMSKAIGVAKDLIVGYFNLMITPIQTVVDLVKSVIDWLGKIKIPSGLSSLAGAVGLRVAGRGNVALDKAAALGGGGGGLTIIEQVTFAGPVYNGTDVARQLVRELRRYGIVVGQGV